MHRYETNVVNKLYQELDHINNMKQRPEPVTFGARSLILAVLAGYIAGVFVGIFIS